jgi:tetratricopeptide (TPR) repeat protein
LIVPWIEGSSVGIFKKILKKKDKGAENPPTQKSKEKKQIASKRTDPLAPPENEGGLRAPPVSPSEQKIKGDPLISREEEMSGEERELPPSLPRKAISSTTPWDVYGEEREESPALRPETPVGTLGPVPRKVREAEKGLADLERTLTEAAFLFKGTEALPRVKILLVEAKIKLAEADIKLSEAEIAPADSQTGLAEIESRISMAEAKIGEAEKILSSLSVQGPGKESFSRLKIGVAGMKIRLAEIQIALAGSSLEGALPSSAFPLSDPQRVQRIPADLLTPNLPKESEPIHMAKQDGMSTDRQPVPPKEVKIRDEGIEGVPGLDLHIEPVHIREEPQEPLIPPTEQGIILPDMGSDASPFETGINMNRVRIPREGSSGETDPQSVSQERVKIRSDERESAWVSEDGSLKIVSRERSVSEHPDDDEKPRISFQQPEVEKALVIEELNRQGIELRKKGEIEAALHSFDRVLAVDPENEAALHNKGVALRSAGRYEEALTCFDHAQERDPDNPVIWFNRGFCLGKLERYEEALKAFDRVLALNPDYKAGWFNKGKILQKMGRMEEAEEHLKKAQELGYR